MSKENEMEKTFQQISPEVVEQIIAEAEAAMVYINRLPDGYIKNNLTDRLCNINSLVVNNRPARNISEAMRVVEQAG